MSRDRFSLSSEAAGAPSVPGLPLGPFGVEELLPMFPACGFALAVLTAGFLSLLRPPPLICFWSRRYLYLLVEGGPLEWFGSTFQAFDPGKRFLELLIFQVRPFRPGDTSPRSISASRACDLFSAPVTFLSLRYGSPTGWRLLTTLAHSPRWFGRTLTPSRSVLGKCFGFYPPSLNLLFCRFSLVGMIFFSRRALREAFARPGAGGTPPSSFLLHRFLRSIFFFSPSVTVPPDLPFPFLRAFFSSV